MSETCELAQIKENSAKSAMDLARKDFEEKRQARLSCQGPAAIASAATADAQSDIDRLQAEGEQLTYMNEFLLKQLRREAESGAAYEALGQLVADEVVKIEGDIESVKSALRTERRRSLDSDPSAPTAVAGMYFTKEPDNQALIAFIACYCAFLLFTGLIVLLRLVPEGSYFSALSQGESVKIVVIYWVAGLLLAYMGFWLFT
jgi:hypothetical protein